MTLAIHQQPKIDLKALPAMERIINVQAKDQADLSPRKKCALLLSPDWLTLDPSSSRNDASIQAATLCLQISLKLFSLKSPFGS